MHSVVPSAVHISPEHSEISEPVTITINFSSSASLHRAQWKLRYVVSHGCPFHHREKLLNVIASGVWQVDMANARHVIDVARSEFVDYRYV